MPHIIGKYKGKLIERCCSQGKWTFSDMRSSGGGSCFHSGYSFNWDYLDVNKLKEIRDESIINEAEEQLRLEPQYKKELEEIINNLDQEELQKIREDFKGSNYEKAINEFYKRTT